MNIVSDTEKMYPQQITENILDLHTKDHIFVSHLFIIFLHHITVVFPHIVSRDLF